jgi:dihydroxyacetone kinase-like protein
VSIGASDVRAWIGDYAEVIAENRMELVRLDTAIGDGDHGTNMDRGMKAAVEKLEATEGDDIGALLKGVGMALVSKVGGAAGPLYGTLFLQLGTATAGKTEVGLREWADALEAAIAGVQARGKAQLEDKTMIDALVPAVEALKAKAAEGADFGDALRASADAAEQGRDATTPLEAKRGRASYLGPRSIGHQDPGATSSALLLRAAASRWG